MMGLWHNSHDALESGAQLYAAFAPSLPKGCFGPFSVRQAHQEWRASTASKCAQWPHAAHAGWHTSCEEGICFCVPDFCFTGGL